MSDFISNIYWIEDFQNIFLKFRIVYEVYAK